MSVRIGRRSSYDPDREIRQLIPEVEVHACNRRTAVRLIHRACDASKACEHNGCIDLFSLGNEIDGGIALRADRLGHGHDVTFAHRNIAQGEAPFFISRCQAHAAAHLGPGHRVAVSIEHDAADRADPTGQQDIHLFVNIGEQLDPGLALDVARLLKGIDPNFSCRDVLKGECTVIIRGCKCHCAVIVRRSARRTGHPFLAPASVVHSDRNACNSCCAVGLEYIPA